MSGKEGSVAPKERINVTFKPSTGEGMEELELPLKLMMIGDYTLTKDDRKLEDRKAININKNNFNEVLENQNIGLDLQVPNRLSNHDVNEEIALSLRFKTLKDFDPANLVQQVPEMKALMELRDALVALKGPLGNVPSFRKAIEEVLTNQDAREKVLAELGMVEK
ncbi:type VI secretion protein, VC_A0107 family [Tolumonas auensis DSM 9187]|uniref:Type VI secretion protein, VC_A0107 family n=1 Tax=Tolumonas auensis (strain DSM 9187 / NBRC 110442 / TA 4) TaxID=595494 RepID=C4L825_TOLAT|nr:type VI secretion system contractile sheath small subunit [Tolumonas auensis]ACQ91824.1 type VI secretion protein, VC_A0107 family [Tolumonas auensis DSM 9187]